MAYLACSRLIYVCVCVCVCQVCATLCIRAVLLDGYEVLFWTETPPLLHHSPLYRARGESSQQARFSAEQSSAESLGKTYRVKMTNIQCLCYQWDYWVEMLFLLLLIKLTDSRLLHVCKMYLQCCCLFAEHGKRLCKTVTWVFPVVMSVSGLFITLSSLQCCTHSRAALTLSPPYTELVGLQRRMAVSHTVDVSTLLN